jgi:hypothetical protein
MLNLFRLEIRSATQATQNEDNWSAAEDHDVYRVYKTLNGKKLFSSHAIKCFLQPRWRAATTSGSTGANSVLGSSPNAGDECGTSMSAGLDVCSLVGGSPPYLSCRNRLDRGQTKGFILLFTSPHCFRHLRSPCPGRSPGQRAGDVAHFPCHPSWKTNSAVMEARMPHLSCRGLVLSPTLNHGDLPHKQWGLNMT